MPSQSGGSILTIPGQANPGGDPVNPIVDSPQVGSLGSRHREPKRHQILTGVVSSYIQNGVSLVVGFIATPIYLSYLGNELFGLWMTLWSILGYLYLSSLGLPVTISARIAEAYVRKDDEKISRVLVTSFLILLGTAVIGITVMALLIAVGVIHANLFRGSKEVTEMAIPTLVVLAVGFLMAQPMDVFRLAVRSIQRVDIEQGYMAMLKVITLGLGTSVLALGGGLIGLALATSVCQLGLMLTFGVVARRALLGLRSNFSLFDLPMARSFVVPSLYCFAISAAGALIWGTDNLVISLNMGPAAVTPFAVAMQVLNVGSGLIAAAINAMIPAVTALHAFNEGEKLRRVLIHVVKIEFALASLLSLGFVYFGEDFLRLWVGPKYVAPGPVLYVLIAIFFIRAFAMSFEMVVVGTLRHHGYAYVALTEGMLNLALSIILIKRFGLLGVALGTLIAQVACTAWFLPVQGLRIIGSRMQHVIFRSVLPTLPAIAAAAFAAGLFLELPMSAGWGRFLVGSGMTASVFLGAFWMLGLSSEERMLFRLIPEKVGSS